MTARRWLRRWVLLGLCGLGFAGQNALANWSANHSFFINASQSLPNWAFFITRDGLPERDDYVFFAPPQSHVLDVHFGDDLSPFGKRALGMPGDLVTREANVVSINGQAIAPLKSHTRLGLTLTPGPTGRVPEGCYYLGTRHPDGFDSRYAEIGFVCANRLLGTGEAIL